MLLGSRSVHVCTAAMHYGFRLVEHLISGLEMWMIQKGFTQTTDFIGKSVPSISNWGDLDLGYKVVAEIDQGTCVHCVLCYVACEDGAHQSIKYETVPLAGFVDQAPAAQIEISGGVSFMPGAGDELQLEKAGVLEVADLIVIHKGDRPEADILLTQAHETLGRQRPVLKVSALRNEGIEPLADAMLASRT